MKRVWMAMLVFALAAALAAAQEHSREKKASADLDITMAVKVAGYNLEPGKYRLACDRKTLTFTRLDTEKKIALPCRGKQLERKAQITELYTDLDEKGVRVVQKLLLRGSNVAHSF